MGKQYITKSVPLYMYTHTGSPAVAVFTQTVDQGLQLMKCSLLKSSTDEGLLQAVDNYVNNYNGRSTDDLGGDMAGRDIHTILGLKSTGLPTGCLSPAGLRDERTYQETGSGTTPEQQEPSGGGTCAGTIVLVGIVLATILGFAIGTVV